MIPEDSIIGKDDPILVTGATGFIGSKVVECLLQCGFRNLRCFARTSSKATRLEALGAQFSDSPDLAIIRGNLLSPEDCRAAARDVAVVYHLAAGTGEKSYPDAFMNSVVTTRNLLEACVRQPSLKRFVSISSFAVYSNRNKAHRRVLDESCPVEDRPEVRGEAYCYAKVKQDELIMEYGKTHRLPYVLLRPGAVYGPGKNSITGRVGVGTFGIFLHLGGSNSIPLTYVDNCADAIVLAGLKPGVDEQILNVVDDELPSSRQFLRLYKKNVKSFRSIYLPHFASYLLCYLWERYSKYSYGQLPPAYNRGAWHAYWKKTSYSNQKLKSLLGWSPKVPTSEGLKSYFAACRQGGVHA
jgi:nucleoside-diphosphate-sugar epimerase